MIRPLGNRVVVRRAEEQIERGHLILPEGALGQPRAGEVVAIGPGVPDDDGHLEPPGVSVGDRILFACGMGREIRNGDYLILHEDDILGILDI